MLPLNVRLPLSSISPEGPTITTRLFVRSDTLRLLTVALLETLSVPPTLRLVPT